MPQKQLEWNIATTAVVLAQLTLSNSVAASNSIYVSVTESSCVDGSFGVSGVNCTECPTPGWSCPLNATEPITCPIGHYCPDTQNLPSYCDCQAIDGAYAAGHTAVDLPSCGAWKNYYDQMDCTLTDGCKVVHDGNPDGSSSFSLRYLGGMVDDTCSHWSCMGGDYTVTAIVQVEAPPANMFHTNKNVFGFLFDLDDPVITNLPTERLSSKTKPSQATLASEGIGMTFYNARSEFQLYSPQQTARFLHYEPISALDYRGDQTIRIRLSGGTIRIWWQGHLTAQAFNVKRKPGSIGMFAFNQKLTFKSVRISRHNCQAPCPRGTFSEVHGATTNDTCVSCPAPSNYTLPGTYQGCGTEFASTEQLPLCQPGFYCPGESIADPVACPYPYTTMDFGSDKLLDCVPCPEGFECSSSAHREPMECPAGSYCPIGELDAIPCPHGTYRAETGGKSVTDCVVCPEGYHGCNRLGSTSMFECPKGYYCLGNYTVPHIDDTLDDPALLVCGCYPLLFGSCSGIQDVVGNRVLVGVQAMSAHLVGSANTIRKYDNVYETVPSHWERTTEFGSEAQYAKIEPSFSVIDYAIEATLELVQQNPHSTWNAFSISLRDNGLAYQIEYNTVDGVKLKAYDAFEVRVLNSNAYHIDLTKPFKFTASVVGSTIRVYVNDELVTSFTDGDKSVQQYGKSVIKVSTGHWRVSNVMLKANGHCDTGYNSPTMCHAGTFQDETGQVECKQCMVGTDGCETWGTTNPVRCPPGYQCHGGSHVREKCEPGSYSVNGTLCEECAVGSFISYSGASQCERCSAGMFAAVKGQKQCKACPVGTYASMKGSVSCLECPENTYRDSLGGRSVEDCDPCEPGTYSTSGMGSCHICGASMYSYNVSDCGVTNTRVVEYYTTHKQCALNPPSIPLIDPSMPCSFVHPESRTAVAIMAISLGCALVHGMMATVLIHYRRNPMMTLALGKVDLIFLCLGSIGSFALLGSVGSTSCTWTEPLLDFSFALYSCCLYIKAKFHAHKYVSFAVPFNLSTQKVKLLAFIAFQALLFLAALTGAGPEMQLRPSRYVLNPRFCLQDNSNCESTLESWCAPSSAFGTVLNVLTKVAQFTVLVVGVKVNWGCRKSLWAFSEASFTFFSLLNAIVTWSLRTLLVVILVPFDGVQMTYLSAVLVALTFGSTTCIAIFPKLYHLRSFSSATLSQYLRKDQNSSSHSWASGEANNSSNKYRITNGTTNESKSDTNATQKTRGDAAVAPQ